MAERTLVIDADGHTFEPPDLWVDRMDADRWGDWIPAGRWVRRRARRRHAAYHRRHRRAADARAAVRGASLAATAWWPTHVEVRAGCHPRGLGVGPPGARARPTTTPSDPAVRR